VRDQEADRPQRSALVRRLSLGTSLVLLPAGGSCYWPLGFALGMFLSPFGGRPALLVMPWQTLAWQQCIWCIWPVYRAAQVSSSQVVLPAQIALS
jgi:hypothetical protein